MVSDSPNQLSPYARLMTLALVVSTTVACGFGPNSLGTFVPFLEPAPEPTPISAQYEVKPKSVSDGLGELDSYKANVIVEFEGERTGQPIAGRMESLTQVVKQPPALHRYLKTELITPTTTLTSGIAELYELDERIYVRNGRAGNWLAVGNAQSLASQLATDEVGLFELDQLIILPLTVSTPPQSETLNELSVQHYSFTERDLPRSNLIFDKAQGELWIASHGNFLMHYVISATLRTATPIPQAHLLDQGQLTLHYSLTDINTDLTINPPSISTMLRDNQLDHLPRLPDAEISSIFPTLIEYTSVISPISATLYYRDELTAQAWTENNAEIFNEKTRLIYSKEDQRLDVIITPTKDPNKVKVVLNLKP
jgi:hypothetical protein